MNFQKRRKKFKTIELKLFGEQTKATLKVNSQLYADSKLYFSLEVDAAFMLKAFYRPIFMSDFLKRTRYNLTEELIEYIYVLAKTSHEEKNNINTTEWTYSFSHIENHILTSFSDAQRLVYVIFKSIFNKSLKFLDEDLLTSYIVKTIVLWRFEEINLGYQDWQNDSRIWEVTEMLFQDLLNSFEKGFLKHYFIPEINVIKRLDKNLRNSCEKRIKEILPNSLKRLC